MPVRPQDISAHSTHARARDPFWGVLLCPEEWQKPSKTGQFDDTLILDGPDYAWLQNLMPGLRGNGGEELVFNLSVTQLNALWRRAVVLAGVKELDQVPYHMRHTGVSHELVTGRRSLAECKRRGRWGSDKSLRRFAKGGRLGEQLARHPPCIREHCSDCHALIGAICGQRRKPLPPGAGRA